MIRQGRFCCCELSLTDSAANFGRTNSKVLSQCNLHLMFIVKIAEPMRKKSDHNCYYHLLDLIIKNSDVVLGDKTKPRRPELKLKDKAKQEHEHIFAVLVLDVTVFSLLMRISHQNGKVLMKAQCGFGKAYIRWRKTRWPACRFSTTRIH